MVGAPAPQQLRDAGSPPRSREGRCPGRALWPVWVVPVIGPWSWVFSPNTHPVLEKFLFIIAHNFKNPKHALYAAILQKESALAGLLIG